MRAAVLVDFVRKQRGVNAAEDDPGAARAREPSNLVSPKRVPRVDPDADDVALRDFVQIDGIQRFVDEMGVAPLRAGRRREDVKPARSDDGHPERQIARVNQMYAGGHEVTSLGECSIILCLSIFRGETCPWAGRGSKLMAHRSRPTTNKRQREQARIAKRNDKAARLADRAKNSTERAGLPAGVDPDIADIRPGPQPLADWQIDPEEKPEEA